MKAEMIEIEQKKGEPVMVTEATGQRNIGDGQASSGHASGMKESAGQTRDGKTGSVRYALLDTIRGVTLLSMIAFHGAWDLVYIYGVDWSFYRGPYAYIWQQSICWTFIFLSGFCANLGKKHLKRGLMVFGGGLLVTIVTLVAMPENRVVFGVLTLLGSCMLLVALTERFLQKLPAGVGLLSSAVLFFLTRNVNDGFLGFEGIRLVKLPGILYQGLFQTYLGFPAPSFYSTDYFSLIPWLFLFMAGYYTCRMVKEKGRLSKPAFLLRIEPFAFLGRHSLLIYLLHQPLLYFLFMLLF